MKTTLAIMIAVFMVSALAACGSSSQTETADTQAVSETQAETEVKEDTAADQTAGEETAAESEQKDSASAAACRKRNCSPGSKGCSKKGYDKRNFGRSI